MKKKVFKIFMLLFLPAIFFGCGIKVEDVEARMKEALYNKYGEEFVVTNIGLREANGQKFYQARIYPKAIIGTEKEGDNYYYASASIDLKSPNKLSDGVGDSYSFIHRNDDVENYLKPKIKEIFGERTRIKVDVKHEVTGDGSWWGGYKSSSLKEMREAVKADPERERIVLELYVYIFDRIETDEELERRRVEVFEFVQYLKKEKLFEYLQMGVIFIDERVLASSYSEYRRKIDYLEKVEEIVKGKNIFLPPKEFRREMSEKLSEEVEEMNEEKEIENINKIKKSNLEYVNDSKYLRYSNCGRFWIESYKHLKEINVYGDYRKAKEEKTLKKHYYNKIDDLEYKEYDYYILGGAIDNKR